jgi:hypothetical protein
MLRAPTVAGVAVWAFSGLVGSAVFLYALPRVEPWIAPIMANQSAFVPPDGRSAGHVCWVWSWVKKRYAEPVVSAWWLVVDGTTAAYPVVAERRQDGTTLTSLRPSPIGPGRTELCVAIPAEVDDIADLRIKGAIAYKPPHGMWTIWQDLPEVEVPPLNVSSSLGPSR